jgi:hypothetical protein
MRRIARRCMLKPAETKESGINQMLFSCLNWCQTDCTGLTRDRENTGIADQSAPRVTMGSHPSHSTGHAVTWISSRCICAKASSARRGWYECDSAPISGLNVSTVIVRLFWDIS